MNGNESLMEVFKNPDTIHSLSMGEKLLGSTITMVLGLGITFMVLILIWIFIAIMGRVLEAADSKKKAAAEAKATPATAEAAAPATIPVEEASDDSLIAVISAAIAEYEGAAADNLVVKKITRLSGDSTPWASAANDARMATRKMY